MTAENKMDGATLTEDDIECLFFDELKATRMVPGDFCPFTDSCDGRGCKLAARLYPNDAALYLPRRADTTADVEQQRKLRWVQQIARRRNNGH